MSVDHTRLRVAGGWVDRVVIGVAISGRCDGWRVDDRLGFSDDGDEQQGEQDGDSLHGGFLSGMWGE